MRLGSDLRTLLLRPVSTSHRLSFSAQKDTDQSLRGSHAPPISRRSIVTVSFRLTLPHHIPQEGLLSSSSPVYAIQFGNSTRFIIVERSRSVCQGGRGTLASGRISVPYYPVRGSVTLTLLPSSFLVPAFIAKKDQRASSSALWSFFSLMNDFAIYSFGPAATSAFPASLPVYLPKFLINLPARSFAFSSHSEAF